MTFDRSFWTERGADGPSARRAKSSSHTSGEKSSEVSANLRLDRLQSRLLGLFLLHVACSREFMSILLPERTHGSQDLAAFVRRSAQRCPRVA